MKDEVCYEPSDASAPPEMVLHYEEGLEAGRLAANTGVLEYARSKELISRYLPPPPATVLDVGGGPGKYALWLAGLGYTVHLVDPVPLHLQQAEEASSRQYGCTLSSITMGDARTLEWPDTSVDVVLLMGPLYHLTQQHARVAALREANRVLKPEALLVAVGISRYASALDGLFGGMIDDPEFASIVKQDLSDGQHRNLSSRTDYFTTAYLHHPPDLPMEVQEAGLEIVGTFAIEGPAWLLPNFEQAWNDPSRRETILDTVRLLEADWGIMGMSAHFMTIARRAR